MRWRTSTHALVLAVGVLAGGAGAAVASIPAADGTIHGCYLVPNGSLRVVDEGVTCRPNETPLNWSQTGPQGPPGTRGPAGGAVPARTVVASDTARPGTRAIAFASCRSDEYLVQGGYSAGTLDPVGQPTQLSVSLSLGVDAVVPDDGIMDEYRVVADNNSTVHTVVVNVFARCAPLDG